MLAAQSDVVVRFNGGANAGHTIIVGQQKFAFHLVPSGTARRGKQNVIAAGVAVDPEVLAEEIRGAQAFAGKVRLIVSQRAHVVLPIHKELDAWMEDRRASGEKLGTTKRGIGPVYQDKAQRSGIRVGDFINEAGLESAVRRAEERLRKSAGMPAGAVEDAVERMRRAAAEIRPYVGDAESFLHKANGSGRRILLEGAQGIMLDVDFGTYPFVTSSNCTAGAASALTGLPPHSIKRVVGVAKAYATRVGAGAFPTELPEDEGGAKLREAGGEYGTTTGRPRRCGWLDLVALRYAVRVGGITELAITKLDVLATVAPLKVGVGYSLDGKKVDTVPARAEEFGRCKASLQSVPALPAAHWKALVKSGKGIRGLPAQARSYLKLIERHTGVPVRMVGVGPGREDILLARPPRK